MTVIRCPWCGDDPLYIAYHDKEWGVPVKDDQTLFEFLLLETFQAGLSWITVLRKRENFRKAFEGFAVRKVASYDEAKIQELMNDKGLIRNRQKIRAAVTNARAFGSIQEAYGSFSNYIWSFVDHRPIQNKFDHLGDLPSATPLSQRISRDLKERGFKFVGPTVIYAHMQATGMVNDHLRSCFRYTQLNEM